MDIVERLRAGPLSGDPVIEEAADEIERLRARIAELEESDDDTEGTGEPITRERMRELIEEGKRTLARLRRTAPPTPSSE